MSCNCSKDAYGDYQCNGELRVVSVGSYDLDVAMAAAFSWMRSMRVWSLCLAPWGVALSFVPGAHNPIFCPQFRNLVEPFSLDESTALVWKYLEGTLEPPPVYLYVPERQGINLDSDRLPCLQASWPDEPDGNERRRRERHGDPFVKGWELSTGGRNGLVGCVTVAPVWTRFPHGPHTDPDLAERQTDWSGENKRRYADRHRVADGMWHK